MRSLPASPGSFEHHLSVDAAGRRSYSCSAESSQHSGRHSRRPGLQRSRQQLGDEEGTRQRGARRPEALAPFPTRAAGSGHGNCRLAACSYAPGGWRPCCNCIRSVNCGSCTSEDTRRGQITACLSPRRLACHLFPAAPVQRNRQSQTGPRRWQRRTLVPYKDTP